MENKNNNIEMENKDDSMAANWKMYIFIVGLVLGAVIGATAFFM